MFSVVDIVIQLSTKQVDNYKYQIMGTEFKLQQFRLPLTKITHNMSTLCTLPMYKQFSFAIGNVTCLFC